MNCIKILIFILSGALPIVQTPQRKQSGKDKRKIDLWLVGVDEAKLMVSRRLESERVGPGYCHFPIQRETDWYKQLTAEKLVIKYIKGQPIREWYKPDRARNEALDCRVYTLAALKIMNPNLKRISERVINEVTFSENKKAETIETKKKQVNTVVKKKSSTVIVKKKRVLGNKK